MVQCCLGASPPSRCMVFMLLLGIKDTLLVPCGCGYVGVVWIAPHARSVVLAPVCFLFIHPAAAVFG